MQLNQVKQEMKNDLQQVQLKLRQIEHQETEIREYFGQLAHRQEDFSQEVLSFKSKLILNNRGWWPFPPSTALSFSRKFLTNKIGLVLNS